MDVSMSAAPVLTLDKLWIAVYAPPHVQAVATQWTKRIQGGGLPELPHSGWRYWPWRTHFFHVAWQ